MKNMIRAAVLLVLISAFPMSAYAVTTEETDVESRMETPESVINSHYKVKGTVTWTDNDNNDGLRPYAVTINLYNGDKLIDITKASSVNNWIYEFPDLPSPDGVNMSYRVTMDPVQGYEITSSQRDTQTPDVSEYDFTAVHTGTLLAIQGIVVWDDDENRDGIRPDKIKVTLLSDESVIDSKVVTAEDKWDFIFNELPKFRESEEIGYSITASEVDGYETGTGELAVRYTHSPETINVSGSIAFDDSDNQDGIRPDHIQVVLMNKGAEIASCDAATENGYSYLFEDVPKNENGMEIHYSVSTEDVDGYEIATANDSITYVHNASSTDISGHVIWNDADDSNRPDSVQIVLYGDGVFVESMTAEKEHEWKYTFDGLPRYKNGREIEYSLDESDIKGYRKEVSGSNIVNSAEDISQNSTPVHSQDEEPEKPQTERKTAGFLLPIILILAAASAVAVYSFRKGWIQAIIDKIQGLK